MKKRVDDAFGKKQYLLGQKDGTYYWLEEAKWECEWYWGLGYVETFTNNKEPHLSVDIESHNHFDGMFLKNNNQNGYDAFKAFFDETVVSDKELWTLIECMKSLYTLREYSDFLYRGGSHYTSNPCKELIMNNTEYERINKELIPALLNQVYSLLSVKIEYEYAVEEYDENSRFYRQYEVYSSLKEAKKNLANVKAENANASSGHSFGIFKIVYKNGLEVEAERME